MDLLVFENITALKQITDDGKCCSLAFGARRNAAREGLHTS